MKNKENWRKGNLLCGRYYLYAGIVLSIFVTIMRCIKVVAIQWNSLIVTTVSIIVMLILLAIIDKKLK
ncbi:MAG: SdpI family protein [Eubacteriales bacterium]|nr:SdpI family protein [Eubacteriales bacterium]